VNRKNNNGKKPLWEKLGKRTGQILSTKGVKEERVW